ncbi:unnamed protein product (macronuclear) [Paramecium tetraurelia]|uniref:Uncharacterized protein n=1 Tax=Paramecium tetraurelia TaxID=5888 RepID=A0BFW8_PARTE|nr:uncharacterized protein GSPATT00028470001 [Paramecium tetraurelia]CAK57435.1 unnamed protein product [Paramecium tetraurelia]|eukprot:XP_001424833.1 hypothetical protein (macronuclear) [Paramecium tetraurelia strain d4-2]
MSDNQQSSEIQEQSVQDSSLQQEQPQESKVLNTWARSSKDLIDKYKNKFDAFKAMAVQAGYTEAPQQSIKIETNINKIEISNKQNLNPQEDQVVLNKVEIKPIETQDVTLQQQVSQGISDQQNEQTQQEVKLEEDPEQLMQLNETLYKQEPINQTAVSFKYDFSLKFADTINLDQHPSKQEIQSQKKLDYLQNQELRVKNSDIVVQKEEVVIPDHPVVANNYMELLDQFKSAATLEDLTDLFNRRTPFKERYNQQELPSNPTNNTSNTKVSNDQTQKSKTKTFDTLLQQFNTPNKFNQEVLTENGSGKNGGTYLNSQVPQVNVKLSNGKSPNARFGFIQASPSSQFIGTSGQKTKKENTYLNVKVQQTMNFTVEVKDNVKPYKRKDELSNFMGKLGLGKYEAPKVTINLDSQNGQNAFDRLKNYVNNIGNTSAKRTPSLGLDELVNDKSFNTCTFKQQVKAFKKDKGERGESTQRQGIPVENPMLQNQSFKNLHLKLLHHQRADSQVGKAVRI